MLDKSSKYVDDNTSSNSRGPTSTSARLRSPILYGIYGGSNAQCYLGAMATQQAVSSGADVAGRQGKKWFAGRAISSGAVVAVASA